LNKFILCKILNNDDFNNGVKHASSADKNGKIALTEYFLLSSSTITFPKFLII